MLNPRFYNSADEVWIDLIHTVMEQGEDVSPRGLPVKEILAHTTSVDMTRPIVTCRPKMGYKFMVAEAWWILSGKNDVESIQAYSPHIASFSNDGVRFDGSYGPRVIDQLRYICDTLTKDWASRQAVMEIWRPNPRESGDVPCTVAVQWMVRKHVDGVGVGSYRLHCFDTMRSSDAWLGWPYDVFNFSMLSAYIALTLRNVAKAKAMTSSLPSSTFPLQNLKLGKLHLTAGSQHLYKNPNGAATNIPYSFEDVFGVLERAPSWNNREKNFEKHYSPLNLDHFEGPWSFLKYLEFAKDSQPEANQWLHEVRTK